MTTPNLYDEIPYRTIATPTTHPERLATLATLYGLDPVPTAKCRVLEIGCGDANNLIPMAVSLPESTFVGLDLSGQAIAAGKAFAGRFDLKNLTLLEKDLMSVTPDFGTFDYIIAHGLYAWVPPPVQDKLLSICRANLSPRGVAYVSYNTYPGAHLRKIVREMTLHLLGSVEETTLQRESRARMFLANLRQPRPLSGENGALVGKLANRMFELSRDALLHDALTEQYRPAYFHEFMDHAGRHRLQYLGESEFWEMDDRILRPEDLEGLRGVAGNPRLVREQYLDFLKVKGFRQTLLCPAEAPVRSDPSVAGLEKLRVMTRAHPVAIKPGSPSSPEVEYRTSEGVSMSTDHPAINRILQCLENAWPHSVPYRELPSEGVTAAELSEFILGLYGSWLVELAVNPPAFVREPGPLPSTTRLVRLQLERRDTVTNQLHMDVRMEGEVTKTLVRLLDGTRDRAELLRGVTPIDPKMSPEALEDGLRRLASLALLIS